MEVKVSNGRLFSRVLFVEEPSDSLKCPIRLKVAKNPKQHECGKSYAKSALIKMEASFVLVVKVELQSTFLMPEVRLF